MEFRSWKFSVFMMVVVALLCYGMYSWGSCSHATIITEVKAEATKIVKVEPETNGFGTLLHGWTYANNFGGAAYESTALFKACGAKPVPQGRVDADIRFIRQLDSKQEMMVICWRDQQRSITVQKLMPGKDAKWVGNTNLVTEVQSALLAVAQTRLDELRQGVK